MENLTGDRRPSLIKRHWNPKSFSDRTVEKEKLSILVESARQTESYRNEQPWSFIIVTKGDPLHYDSLLRCLAQSSLNLARTAPVLVLALAKLNFDSDGTRNKYAFHDLAQAVTNVVLRAGALGLQAHQIAGFDAARARRQFQIPEGHDPVAVVALGYQAEQQPPFRDEREEGASSPRRSIESIVFAGRWGAPAALPGPALQPCP
jgi:nitroreductase